METFLRWISNVLAGVACAVLLAIMAVTFLDVVGRYFFNAPVTFAVELIQLGMGLLVLLGLAVTTLERGHIAVDIVDTVMPRMVRRLFAALAALSGLLFITLIAWRLWDRGVTYRSDGLATDVLFLPVWPVVIIMALAAGVAAVIALAQIVVPDFRQAPPPLAVDDPD